MDSVVVFASRSGNTRAIAEAIADRLRSRGNVRLVSVDDAPVVRPHDVDLVVVGGPTEGRRMTEAMTRYLGRLTSHAFDGAAAAGFDTRLRWPRLLSGSAAVGIEGQLRSAGAHLVAPAESFFVDMTPKLLAGESRRAAEWADSLADAAASGQAPGESALS